MIPTTEAAWASEGRLASDDESTVSMEPPSADGEDGLAAGTMLGEYRVERTLARGGMGTVFAAVHPLIGKRVAIKVLSRAQCSDPASVERFVDEARVVNRIGHANIVDVFAFGAMPDGRQYLVMELLQGETLGARMARARVSLVEACAVMKQLARALGAAHANSVVHRDLKPDNVFLVTHDGGPMVKLLDFGIAKLSHRDGVTRTAAGALVGTPQYIAPEQARGQRVDARSDIYAFGGLLFELLAGRPVFLVHGVTEAIAKHLLEAAPRLSEFAQVPAEIDDLVAAMLAKDPAERPTLDRICDALDRAAAASPPPPPAVTAAPSAPAVAFPAVALRAVAPPASPGVARAGRSRLRSVALLGAALAVAAVALGRAYVARPRSEPTLDPRDATSASAAPSRTPAALPPGAEAAPTRTVTLPPEPPAAATSPPEVPAAPAPEVPAAVASSPAAPAAPPTEAPVAVASSRAAPAADPGRRAAAAEPAGSPAAAEPTGPASDAARSEASASTGEGKLRGAATLRSRSRRTGRLELAIRGARSYVVVVDGVAQGARSELALAPGPHAIEVRAAGELPRRFTVQIEPGKTAQRDVVWTRDTPSPPPPPSVPPPTDDHALMGPGEALPRETPRK